MRCRTQQMLISQLDVYKHNINFDPSYQREGGLWNKDKQGLFIDSILRSYDIPKIYFHDLRFHNEQIQYAIIDGKQRLQAIYGFIKGKFSSASSDGKSKDLFYNDLSDRRKEEFRASSLDIVLVEDADEDDIEDLFYRLNNGTTLSTAEKRNVIGGDMCDVIRELSSKNKFFTNRIRISNKRKVHLEIATRFLLIEHQSIKKEDDRTIDLTKKPLDRFVEENKEISDGYRRKLMKETEQKLQSPKNIFSTKDPFLTRHVFIQTYYILIRNLLSKYAVQNKEIRSFLEMFEKERLDDRKKDDSDREVDFVNFALQVQQGIGNKGAIDDRDRILRKYYLKWHPDTLPKDVKRMFNLEERNLIWILSGKTCQKCQRKLNDFEEMEADHIVPYSKGGKTTISNAQALCKSCNLEKSNKS